MRSFSIGSSSLAIGTATVFIAVAAGLSFIADDGATARPATAWSLRGSIAPEPAPPKATAPDKSREIVARSDIG